MNPQKLKEGDVVLFDGGTSIDGYASDITRTTVFGTPTARQREVWDLEKRAQSAGFAAAQIGAPCEAVDAAARKVIVDAGFGPDYKTPGLPHRTGHGIGLDGHEWTNFVRGNKTPLAPGMCFSDEPMIAIPRRVRDPSRGLPLHDGKGSRLLLAAESRDRQAVCVDCEAHSLRSTVSGRRSRTTITDRHVDDQFCGRRRRPVKFTAVIRTK